MVRGRCGSIWGVVPRRVPKAPKEHVTTRRRAVAPAIVTTVAAIGLSLTSVL